MRNQRIAHRFRLSISMIVLVCLAVGSFWLLQLMDRASEDMQADLRKNEPDYIVEHFSFVRMTKSGQPSYIISGDKLTHRPVDDSSDIELPIVRSLAADKPPMDMHAKTARVDQGNSRVNLRGDVEIDRKGTEQGQPMHMSTQALTIFPDEDRMETDQPVKLKLGNATGNANGMRANNATRQIQLTGRGTLEFPPPAR
jgi:lipopolysaccharide export system protein LptC